MSGWGNAKQRDDEDTFGSPDPLSARSTLCDGDDISSMYGATPFNAHVINEAPPPYGQQGAPRAANEFITVAVSSVQVAPDARGKQVMWYTFNARTLTHRWSVSKRFSDCAQFHEALKRMKLHEFKNEVVSNASGPTAMGGTTTPRGTAMSNTSFGYFSSNMQAALSSGAPAEGFDIPPTFPSKFHHLRGSHSAEFVEKRRKALDLYFKGTLWFLQQLGLAAVGVARKPYAGVLRAAFAVLVDFLRTTSQTHGALAAPGVSDSTAPEANFEEEEQNILSMRGGGVGVGGGGRTSSIAPLSMLEAAEVPRSKIIVEPGLRYTIVLFLPGVLLKEVFVETGASMAQSRRRGQPHVPNAGDRTITVGGTWNSGIHGLQSLREQGVFQSTGGGDSLTDRGASSELPSSAASTEREGSGEGTRSILKRQSVQPPAVARKVLSDTLPRGSFELTFEIPLPFEKAHWYSEYDGGVLLLMWDAPQA